MCGIAGLYSIRPGVLARREDIHRMTSRMAHRGPNAEGHVLVERAGGRSGFFRGAGDACPLSSAEVALGHRRLSIIDLSDRGLQPMSTEDGRVWMSFNGEVYNYVELRSELEALGHHFTSTSDSEVVLKAFVEWGTACFRRFNGMWALAFLDTKTGRLVLSRDRYGKKPLYFAEHAGCLAFASEIKAILSLPGFAPKMNLRKVARYAGQHYRYVDNDFESFFEGVESVPKSAFMTVEPDGRRTVERYWTLTPADTGGMSEGDIVSRFRDLLTDAVRIRLRSDVPVGIMLSGGLDSTSVAALAAANNAKLTAFSGVTGTGYYDESEYIRAAATHIGLDVNFLYPKPAPLFETLKEMLAFHDEPVCTVTWYSLYLMAREVRQAGMTVVLTGHGGDELLGGYWDHYHYNFHDLRAAGKSDEAEHAAWMANHARPEAEYGRERDYVERLVSNRRLEVEKYSKYRDAIAPGLRPHTHFMPSMPPVAGELSRRLYLELFDETVPASLRAEDRNTMAFSTENRVPYLDYRLAEFCFGLGNEFKIRGGMGKWLIRESMKGLLPEKVRLRRDKTGFNAPADQWFRGELKAELQAMIESGSAINTDVYDRVELRRLFADHQAGANHAMFLWQYANLYFWHQKLSGLK